MGFDCSPASFMRDAGLRQFALPFDWIVSNIDSMIKCIKDDFKDFHKGLYLEESKTRIIDKYGFIFPHDYPTHKNKNIVDSDDNVPEQDIIVDNWKDYIPDNEIKYSRRIERFISIMKSNEVLIVFIRASFSETKTIKKLLKQKYNKRHIKFIISTSDKPNHESNIITCNPHIIKWNDPEVWLKALRSLGS